jgi:ElaB/YqjD/DUF883 family membrane-anchored ribosome-binding protein
MEHSTGVQGQPVRQPEPPQQNGDTQDKTREAANKAQEQMGHAKVRAREQVRDQVSQRSTEAGERVRSTAGDVRSVAEELRRQGKDSPARYADQAADRAERLGDYLHQADGDRILRDAEDFGRRNPWAVVAGGLALGFMASRLLKASSSERYHSTAPQPGRALER